MLIIKLFTFYFKRQTYTTFVQLSRQIVLIMIIGKQNPVLCPGIKRYIKYPVDSNQTTLKKLYGSNLLSQQILRLLLTFNNLMLT